MGFPRRKVPERVSCQPRLDSGSPGRWSWSVPLPRNRNGRPLLLTIIRYGARVAFAAASPPSNQCQTASSARQCWPSAFERTPVLAFADATSSCSWLYEILRVTIATVVEFNHIFPVVPPMIALRARGPLMRSALGADIRIAKGVGGQDPDSDCRAYGVAFKAPLRQRSMP
jgi:hypothetical protein